MLRVLSSGNDLFGELGLPLAFSGVVAVADIGFEGEISRLGVGEFLGRGLITSEDGQTLDWPVPSCEHHHVF